jgi:hypothetical protein
VFINVKNFREFMDRVELLWSPDFDDLELEEQPCTPFGGFHADRLDVYFRLASVHPELHMITCLRPSLFVNGFVKGGQAYYLGQGDSDNKLIHDPQGRLDIELLHSLNSGRNKLCP